MKVWGGAKPEQDYSRLSVLQIGSKASFRLTPRFQPLCIGLCYHVMTARSNDYTFRPNEFFLVTEL
jgi:hypothetical protein